MVQNNSNNTDVSKSKFYMLRCLVAMAHADGVFHDDERDYIESMMNKIPLSEEQIATLHEDMSTPQDIEFLFANINEPRFRGQVIHFARIMAMKDGVIDPSEKDLLERLQGYSLKNLNVDEISSDVQRAVQADMLQHEITMDEGRPTKKGKEYTFFRLLDEGLQNVGIDLLQE